MNKTQFTYQRWFLSAFLSILFLFIVMYLEESLLNYLNTEINNFLDAIIGLFALYFGYVATANLKFFKKQGYYWVENRIVFLQFKGKIYELKDLKFIKGKTVTFCGWGKTGSLSIKFGKKKILLFSGSDMPKSSFSKMLKGFFVTDESINNFSESELFALFNTILKHNPDLKKKDDLDYWYEK